MGLTSWATSITATPVGADLGRSGAATMAWLGRSRLSRGSSSSRSRGRGDQGLGDEEALLLAARHLADGPRRRSRGPHRARWPRPPGPRRGGPGPIVARSPAGRSGARRGPCGPRRRPGSASRSRSCGAGAGSRSRWLDCARRAAEHRAAAPRSGAAGPSTALISVDLPTPLGPSTATNSPASHGQVDVAPDGAAAGLDRAAPTSVTTGVRGPGPAGPAGPARRLGRSAGERRHRSVPGARAPARDSELVEPASPGTSGWPATASR